mgnify:CR=1 FL=1
MLQLLPGLGKLCASCMWHILVLHTPSRRGSMDNHMGFPFLHVQMVLPTSSLASEGQCMGFWRAHIARYLSR